MKNQQAIGMVIGSIIGCVLAGALVYLKVSIVIVNLIILGSLLAGSYIGRRLEKANN